MVMAENPKQLNVGQQLKARRQALRISLAQIELDTKIRGKFLTALESGDYSSLPNDIYSRGFVQHYANHLGLDGVKIAGEYEAERGGVEESKTKRPRLEEPKRLVFTPRIFAVLAGFVLIATVFGYLLWQFQGLAGAPDLAITNPPSDTAVDAAQVNVGGHTTPGSDVSINGSPLATDMNGNFSEQVALQNGVNSIIVTSRSKLGKTTTMTRNILAKLPVLGAETAAVPSAPFNGVAVVVKVTQTTAIAVLVDGKSQFSGTFLAGTSKLFTGNTDINLTTGNAGATGVTITNSTVANKVISPLGASGEIRNGQDFTSTTQFQ
jgi:cytoskeletal protein RodZ